MSPRGGGFGTEGGPEVLDLADSRMAVQTDLESAEILTVRDIKSRLAEHAETILRSLGSVPVLGPTLEEAHPVDMRLFVRSMAAHISLN